MQNIPANNSLTVASHRAGRWHRLLTLNTRISANRSVSENFHGYVVILYLDVSRPKIWKTGFELRFSK